MVSSAVRPMTKKERCNGIDKLKRTPELGAQVRFLREQRSKGIDIVHLVENLDTYLPLAPRDRANIIGN
jgi:hypothetical protein